MMKEGLDDFKRFVRDRACNNAKYRCIAVDKKRGLVGHAGDEESIFKTVDAQDIKVGMIIEIKKDQRVPADLVLLHTTEPSGGSFIRTDQLDGETDWKLRRAIPMTQNAGSIFAMCQQKAEVYAEAPRKEIYSFIGTYTYTPSDSNRNRDTDEKLEVESLSLENTIWANTVVASGTILGLVMYTGSQTRSSMNISQPNSKFGVLDREVNNYSKVLCLLLVLLSCVMIAASRFTGLWWLNLFRFVVLFSSIIPISLRVNLDIAKLVYSFSIMSDPEIAGTIVRNTSLPEELGRISYLLTDKTGTLTQNEMIFKKLHLGTVCFSRDGLDEIGSRLLESYHLKSDQKVRKTVERKVHDAVLSMALCHNVTPVFDDDYDPELMSIAEAQTLGKIAYQASSPDEVALVKFSENAGLVLTKRTFGSITLTNPLGQLEEYEILDNFPFTSERKRMGIIIREVSTQRVIFYLKGADSVMIPRVQFSDWLDEECDNMAREGLRTLVFAQRVLSEGEWTQFKEKMQQAKTSLKDRESKVEEVVSSIEKELTLLGLSGVEDKLQKDVKSTLESLRNAGIKIWMLTGDKVETATCIAISSKLVSKTHTLFTMTVKTAEEAKEKLHQFQSLHDCALIIDGSSLQFCLDNFKDEFFAATRPAPAVVCCRCSPTQKESVVLLMKQFNPTKQTCAIGDGGNDVSMIQAAHIGVGIEGKEGKQASLAADISVLEFRALQRLLLWHGRISYQRSARLSQFIIHRGLIISFIQAIFSAIYFWATIAVYTGMLLVGYSTFYTMLPVLALILDEDVPEQSVFIYPELYQELQKGRVLSVKTFFIWVLLSVYQAMIIMVFSLLLFEEDMLSIVSITFTALILCELCNIAFTVRTWKLLIVIAEILTFSIYFLSILILPSYFSGFLFFSPFFQRNSLLI